MKKRKRERERNIYNTYDTHIYKQNTNTCVSRQWGRHTHDKNRERVSHTRRQTTLITACGNEKEKGRVGETERLKSGTEQIIEKHSRDTLHNSSRQSFVCKSNM